MNNRYGLAALILIIFLAAGAFFRLLVGVPLVQSDLIYSAVIKKKPPGTKTPENTVKSFYFFIDSGAFEEAWNIILEPDWTGGDVSVSYFDEVKRDPEGFSNWTEKEEFVNRLKKELGEKGARITLNNIDAAQAAMGKAEFSNEAIPVVDVDRIYKVMADGHILGACTIFRWDKEFYVLEIRGKYKVLLSGTKGRKAFFYQSWFSNLEKFGNIRGLKSSG
jgi:hypothetical protein